MIPSLINLLLAEMVSQINIVFVGKLNNESALAGIGLATALIYCLPVSLTFGMASVLETMVSQAYGSMQYNICGQYLNKQIIVVTCLFIPVGSMLYYSEHFLVKFLGQDENSSKYCQEYLRVALPGIYLDCIV